MKRRLKKIVVTLLTTIIITCTFSLGGCSNAKINAIMEAKYTITVFSRNDESTYSINNYELHDGVCTFTDIGTGREMTVSNFIIVKN